MQGVWFAQTLAFTPIAYLVLVGVVKGINPVLEEAAQTLRGSPAYVFAHRHRCRSLLPGLANAFLIVFIESLADFGNPLLLGGDMQVLSTAIYFAVVGARQDRGVAAVLALILLGLMMSVFLGQRRDAVAAAPSRPSSARARPGVRVEPAAGPAHTPRSPLPAVGRADRGRLRHHPVRRLRRELGPRQLPLRCATTPAFGIVFDGGLRFTGEAWPSAGDHRRPRRDRRAAYRGASASASPTCSSGASVSGTRRVRVRHPDR